MNLTTQQAIFFLNGFWESGIAEQAEYCWTVIKKFQELDPEKAEGHDLDEFFSHRLLEIFENALTVTELREALGQIDADKNKRMAAIEYFIWFFKRTVDDTVRSPQGDNNEALEAAQEKMAKVQKAFAEVQSKLEAQQAALQENEQKLAEQRVAVDAANKAYAEVKAAEDAVRAAEAELQAAVDELSAKEAEYAAKIAALEAKSNDESATGMARAKAANELAQLKAEDPLPLRKAKITQEAALKKVQKERKIAEEKVAVADSKKKALEEVQRQLEQTQQNLQRAVQELEQAYVDLQERMAEAAAELEEAKSKGGVPYGNIWWMERELYEADARLPKAKQKYDHSKPFQFKQ